MAVHWVVVCLVLLTGISLRSAFADVLVMSADGNISGTATTEGAVVYKHASGLYGVDTSSTTNGTGTLSTARLATTNVSATDLQLATSTLPTCAAALVGSYRKNSAGQSCYCNGTEWRDTAPPAVTVLGISVLSFTTCAP